MPCIYLPHFDPFASAHVRTGSRDLHRLRVVLGLDHEKTAQNFLRFNVRPVRNRHFSILRAQMPAAVIGQFFPARILLRFTSASRQAI